MIDRILAVLLVVAIISLSCLGVSYFMAAPMERTAAYAIDTAVSQANAPLSPTDALDANTARLNQGGVSLGLVVLLIVGAAASGFVLLFLRYGQDFLKQYRLATKKKSKKLVTRPRPVPLLPPPDPIIEGESWND